tara:strand:+ start:4494 stop:4739 length:246 start_codon:yes stop_codon:yes gene_type:complete
MTKQSQVVTIDGKEYPVDDLKSDQKVLIDQITLCQNKINELSVLVRQIDIYQIAKNDYVHKLSTSLQTDETLQNIEDSEAG